jgi:hypothetical protein
VSTHPHIAPEDIEHRFGYHRATFPVGYDPKTNTPSLATLIGRHDADGNEATAPMHAYVRQQFIRLANQLLTVVPHGREQELMLTALQEASQWANAGIAMQAPLVKE